MKGLEIIIDDLEKLKNSLETERENNLIQVSAYDEKINYYNEIICLLTNVKKSIEAAITSHSNARWQIIESGEENVLNLFDKSFKGYTEQKLISLMHEHDECVMMYKLSWWCYNYFKGKREKLIHRNKEINERVLDIEMELSALNNQNIERGKTK